jgi:cyclophilin family peptidyl-prolyl cis-trans isomerase
LATSVSLLCAGTVPPHAAAKPTEEFTSAYNRYLALDKQLGELMKLYLQEATPARDTVFKEYQKVVEKADTAVADLRAAAIADYTARPNEEKKVTQVLLGLAANDLKHDRYESAADLTKLLIEQECPEMVVYDLAGQAAYAQDDFAGAETLLIKAKEAKTLTPDGRRYLEDIPTAKERWATEQELRQTEGEANDLPRVKLETTKGDIVLELFENESPQTVGNFVSLVEDHKYDGLAFHRVIAGSMAQGGDPKGDGTGGPGYHIYCECYEPNHRNHFRGTLSMAHAGRDTGGSQFFLTFQRAPQLDGKHTAFGRVIEGLEVLGKLQRRVPSKSKLPEPDKIVKATVLRKREHDYEPTKVARPAEPEKKKEPGKKEPETKTESKDKPDSKTEQDQDDP